MSRVPVPGNGNKWGVMATDHIRGGRFAVRPYIFGRPDMIEFVQEALGGEISARFDSPGGSHVEFLMEDTLLVMECMDEFPDGFEPTVGSIYLYVEDVDATYTKAIEHGGASIAPPEDKPYGERQCGITDPFGNTWWIATYKPELETHEDDGTPG